MGEGDPRGQHQAGVIAGSRPSPEMKEGAMKLPHRRHFLHLAAGAAALPAVSRFAWAQAYPTRSVRIIAATGPGGAPDILARLLGQWLSERLGQPFVTRTGRVAATPSAPKWWCAHRRTAIRSSWSTDGVDQRDALREAQLQFHPRYRDGRGYRPVAVTLWWCIHRFQPRRFPSSSPTPKPTPGKINMASAGIGTTPATWPASCSR